MTKNPKMTKKKLKEPDEFMSVSEGAYVFIRDHRKPIVAALGAVVLIVLAVFLFQMWNRSKEEAAGAKFAQAVEAYQRVAASAKEGTPSDSKTAMEGLAEVTAQYPGTGPGRLALLYRGNLHLRAGEFDEAVKAYSQFFDRAGKERLYSLLALEGLGYAYEGKKDWEKAVGAFRKIVDQGDNFLAPDAYVSLGRCYEKSGKNAEALEAYKGFLKVAQKTQTNYAVLRKISSLEKKG
jgi:tetratricopeptide (TPR) repeat protein